MTAPAASVEPGRPPMVHEVEIRTLAGADEAAVHYDAAAWRVRQYRLAEQLGSPGRLAIDLVSDDVDLDVDSLLGADFELVSSTSDRRRVFSGVVMRAEYVGTYGLATHVRLVVQPAVALAGQTRRSRVFQEMSAVEICCEVLGPLLVSRGRAVDIEGVQRQLVPRDYCMQFRETDLEFVTRILAEEGVSFAFEHGEEVGHEHMVLLDDNARMAPIGESLLDPSETEPTALSVVPRRVSRAGVEEALDHLSWRRELSTRAVRVVEHDWHYDPAEPSVSTADADTALPWMYGASSMHDASRIVELGATDTEAGELVLQGGAHARRVRRRSTVDGARAVGRGQVLGLQPGRTLEVFDHPLHDLNGRYAVIASEAVADDPSADRSNPSARPPSWETRFEAIPLDTPFVPAIPPRPVVSGPLTAIVVGPEADDIHTDQHGRIRVRFPWQAKGPEAGNEHRTSCWVRCGQSWAGPGYGMQFIPRVGMEVLVAFLDGNPDRPVCVGCVYNGRNDPPFCPPENKAHSGLRTRSTPHGDGFNELRFDDTCGREEVYLRAERNLRRQIRAASSTSVGASRSLSVGKDDATSIGGDSTLEINGGQVVQVGTAAAGPADPPEVGVARLTAESKRLVSAGARATTTVGPGEESVVDIEPGTIRLTAKDRIELRVGGSLIRITPDGIDLVYGEAPSGRTPLAEVHLNGAGATVASDLAVTVNRTEYGSPKSWVKLFGGELAAWATDKTRITGGTAKVELDDDSARLEGVVAEVCNALDAGLRVEPASATLRAPALHLQGDGMADVVGGPLHLNRPGARKS